MSFYLRKSVKVGPLRFNLSKSGIGVSTGLKRFRVGTGPRGNYVHMGVGGIYYRKTLPTGGKPGGGKRASGAGGGSPPPLPGEGSLPPPFVPPVPMTEIESGDVSRMAHSSSAELLQELNDKRTLTTWWPVVAVACGVVLLLMMVKGFSPILLVMWLILSVYLGFTTYTRDALRKTVVLLYDFEPSLEHAFENLHQAASILSKCSGCWHIAASGKVGDGRYHAGASSLVDRKQTSIRAQSPGFLKTNVETVAITVGRQTLYFFPDRLLVYDEGRIGAVGYDEIKVAVKQTRFIEDGTPPRDARVVDHTYRYVNKNGTPDKRFSNNARLPICLYDEMHFTSRSGLNEVLQVSHCGVGISLAESIRAFGKLARPGIPSEKLLQETLPPSVPANVAGKKSSLFSPIPASIPSHASPNGIPHQVPSGPIPRDIILPGACERPPEFSIVGKRVEDYTHLRAVGPQVESTFTPPPLRSSLPGTPPPPQRIPMPPSPSVSVHSTAPPKKYRPLQWIAPGETVEVAGRTISGMVYTSLVNLDSGSEPSAINRSAQVGRHAPTPEDLSYYPNYSGLSPSGRAFYLDWLAKGRREHVPDRVPTGYVFLFFYGIERRVLVEEDRDPALWSEVLDLLKAYGLTRSSCSLASYLGDFLHFSSYQAGPEEYSRNCRMLLQLQGRRASETAMALALANHHRTDSPIDWSMGLSVAMNLEESRRSVVTERTGETFTAMFRNRFQDIYPDGMKLKASKRDHTVRYQTGNATLSPRFNSYGSGGNNSDAATLARVPGVMKVPSQFKNLSSIWNQCIEDLSGYSWAMSKLSSAKAVSNQDRFKAHMALPSQIRRDHPHPLAKDFTEVFQTCPTSGDIRFAPVGLLAGLLGFEERATLTQAQSGDVAALAESLGYTIAPHPEILNLPLGWSQEVALAAWQGSPKPSKELGGLLRLLYLAILVASADGVADEAELEVFHQTIPVSADFDRIQIRATEAALTRDSHVASKQLLRIAKSIYQKERGTVFKLLVHIACSDGVLSTDENRLLRRISKAFELGEDALDDLLTEDSTFQTVTVSRGKASTKGEAIPQPIHPATSSFSLNKDRIAALTAETAEVVSILAKALEEESESQEDTIPIAAGASSAPSPSVPDWMQSLESRYHLAFIEMITVTNGLSIDLAIIAGRHHLMTDDLVDGINGWSDEALGDFLIEMTDGNQATLRRDLLPNN